MLAPIAQTPTYISSRRCSVIRAVSEQYDCNIWVPMLWPPRCSLLIRMSVTRDRSDLSAGTRIAGPQGTPTTTPDTLT